MDIPSLFDITSRLPLWWKTVYWLTLSFRLFLGYTSLHDRNDNSTPPSGTTQMSYLQMNSLRNGSSASSGTAGNQTSIYPTMLKEENPSSTNSSYPSLSELSVRDERRLFLRAENKYFSSVHRTTAFHTIHLRRACTTTNSKTTNHCSNHHPI